MITETTHSIITDILMAMTISEKEFLSKLEQSDIKQKSSVITNCLYGLLLYLKGDFSTALKYFNDSEIILNKNNNAYEKIFYNFILGYVNFCEKNSNLYMLYYNKSLKIANESGCSEFLANLENIIKNTHIL